MPKQLTIPGTGRFGHGTIRSEEARRQIARMQRKAVMGAMEQTIQDRYNAAELEHKQRGEMNARLEAQIEQLHKQRIDNVQKALIVEGAMKAFVTLGAKPNAPAPETPDPLEGSGLANALGSQAPDAPIVEVVRG